MKGIKKFSIEHALVTNSSSSVSQLEKDNIELKARLDELSSKYNVLQANYVQQVGLLTTKPVDTGHVRY
jgi:hypothetical protein